MSGNDLLVWLPAISILVWLPEACYRDWKYREIEHGYWTWLFAINFPVSIWMYYSGYYPLECLWISLVAGGVWFIITKMDWIGGADFMAMAAISLFFVMNPISGRVLMPLVVAEYFVASCAVCWVAVKLMPDNIYRDVITKFPLMITITMAFCMALMWG